MTAEFSYDGWAAMQAADPERDIVLSWKAVHLARLFRKNFGGETIGSIAEVGGAEGTVLRTVGRLLGAGRLVNYEISGAFCKAGESTLPEVEFHNEEFSGEGERFDALILSDILEHVEDDSALLEAVARRGRYVLVKMPIEKCLMATPFWYGLRLRRKPAEVRFGPGHHNGHLRGYSVRQARNLLCRHLEVVDSYVTDTSFYNTSRAAGLLRWSAPRLAVGITGGVLFAVCRSRGDQA